MPLLLLIYQMSFSADTVLFQIITKACKNDGMGRNTSMQFVVVFNHNYSYKKIASYKILDRDDVHYNPLSQVSLRCV